MRRIYGLGLVALMLGAGCGSDEQREPRREPKDASTSPSEAEPEDVDAGSPMGSQVDAGRAAGRSDGGRAAIVGDSGARSDATSLRGCPTVEPALGSACSPLGDDCNYGQRTCECVRGSNTWACWAPSDCPDAQPAPASACSLVGIVCEYDPPADAGTGLEETDCECTAAGWDCGALACPTAVPSSGAECGSGEGTCTYAEQICECDSRLWTCWKQSDCPVAQPAERSACSLENVSCLYGANECECERGRWGCGPAEEEEEEEGEEGEEGEEEEEEEEEEQGVVDAG